MKELVTVRSNTYYEQNEGETPFSLKPLMELVVIHTNGKDYIINKDGALLSTGNNDSKLKNIFKCKIEIQKLIPARLPVLSKTQCYQMPFLSKKVIF